jgi:PleD family two-component response regulator
VLRVTLAENRKLSATDDLTRVASRRFFSKHFPREVERAARYGRALSLILCDIDLFKSINDSLGHAGGDQVLKQFGARLQKQLRRGIDWVARIGGEEHRRHRELRPVRAGSRAGRRATPRGACPEDRRRSALPQPALGS